jgi:hypothetical protein
MKYTRLCGYQPQYFPRLHYFNRLLDSEIYEISDYVQFVKKHAYKLPDGTVKRGKSFQAHSVIKQVNGPLFLAVPTGSELLSINETPIDYSRNWTAAHLKSIEIGYRKSPNFEKFFPELQDILNKKYESISDLSVTSTMWGITRLITHEPVSKDAFSVAHVQKLIQQKKHNYRLNKIFLASDSTVSPPAKGMANEWCIDLCKYAGANEYFYGGTSHKAYMDLEKFSKANIKTTLQDWVCSPYPQQYPQIGFVSNLSIIDLIMNTSQAQAEKIIKGKVAFPNFHPAKIIAYGAATYLESEAIFAMMDMSKLF